jgi:pantetheine-phosphate adenylyltransferase
LSRTDAHAPFYVRLARGDLSAQPQHARVHNACDLPDLEATVRYSWRTTGCFWEFSYYDSAGHSPTSRLCRLPGEHAVYPGTFDPITPGHFDIIERARHLFARVTVLVAVNGDKQPATTQSERAIQLRRELPANWGNVSVTAWAGLTVEFCRQHSADVIIRGVRNRTDSPHEYQLAAMNEALGITTLLLPANPRLAAVSSTVLRGLSI